MNQDKNEKRQRWIDAHSDGLLTPEQRAAFDRALAGDASLRNEATRQARIESVLKRQFAPPAPPAIVNRTRDESTPDQPAGPSSPGAPAARRRFWSRPIALTGLAAGLLLAAGGGWWGWTMWQAGQDGVRRFEPPPGSIHRGLEVVYADEVADGFKPDWVCKSERQFVMTTYSRFGEGVLLRDLPEGAAPLGWSYANTISPKTAHLLASVDTHKVIIFIDEAGKDTGQTIPCELGLHLFNRRVGKLVLYEISDMDKPRLLDFFQPYDVPDAWKNTSIYEDDDSPRLEAPTNRTKTSPSQPS